VASPPFSFLSEKRLGHSSLTSSLHLHIGGKRKCRNENANRAEQGDDRDADDAVRPRMSPGGRRSTNLVHLLPGAGYETVLARQSFPRQMANVFKMFARDPVR